LEVEDLEALGVKRGHRKLLLKAAKSVFGDEFNVTTINEKVQGEGLDKDSNPVSSLDIGNACPEKGSINQSGTCEDEENSGGTGPGNIPLRPPPFPIFSRNSDLESSSSRYTRTVAPKRTFLDAFLRRFFLLHLAFYPIITMPISILNLLNSLAAQAAVNIDEMLESNVKLITYDEVVEHLQSQRKKLPFIGWLPYSLIYVVVSFIRGTFEALWLFLEFTVKFVFTMAYICWVCCVVHPLIAIDDLFSLVFTPFSYKWEKYDCNSHFIEKFSYGFKESLKSFTLQALLKILYSVKCSNNESSSVGATVVYFAYAFLGSDITYINFKQAVAHRDFNAADEILRLMPGLAPLRCSKYKKKSEDECSKGSNNSSYGIQLEVGKDCLAPFFSHIENKDYLIDFRQASNHYELSRLVSNLKQWGKSCTMRLFQIREDSAYALSYEDNIFGSENDNKWSKHVDAIRFTEDPFYIFVIGNLSGVIYFVLTIFAFFDMESNIDNGFPVGCPNATTVGCSNFGDVAYFYLDPLYRLVFPTCAVLVLLIFCYTLLRYRKNRYSRSESSLKKFLIENVKFYGRGGGGGEGGGRGRGGGRSRCRGGGRGRGGGGGRGRGGGGGEGRGRGRDRG
jgi:hypothetical protein